MSDETSSKQQPTAQSEDASLSEENLESVAGGVVGPGGCIKPFPIELPPYNPFPVEIDAGLG